MLQGLVNPSIFDDQGQPMFNTYMVSVLHLNKIFDKDPNSFGPWDTLEAGAGTRWKIPQILLGIPSVQPSCTKI